LEDQPTEAQILDALKASGPARGARNPAGDREQSSNERQFIEALVKKNRAPSRSTSDGGLQKSPARSRASISK
jgi:hypothetical protein